MTLFFYSKGETMRVFRNAVVLSAVVAMLAVVAGCEKEGPAEKAGKQIDQAVQQAGDQAKQAADAAGEKLKEAGDKIQDSSK